MPRALQSLTRRLQSLTLRARRPSVLLTAGLAGFAIAAIAAIAVARTFTLEVVRNAQVGNKHESIVATSHGVAVYELIPSSRRNLRCTGMCLSFWRPVTVSSAHAKLTKAPGVTGKLGEFRRGSSHQVTLSGHPLYTFTGDHHTKGVANGDKQAGPGGSVWHVVPAHSTSTHTTSTSTTTTTHTTCFYPPCY